MQMPEENKLTDEEYGNLVAYKLAMGLADSMYVQGIISDAEYDEIDRKMCEKYCIKITSIFRKIGRK